MKKVIVIVGPTGSGKTSLSINLAKRFNGEIINGDSVQVYKELNIGSAKIKDDEKMGIPHHLFDLISVEENYSAYNFQNDARKLIDKIKVPIIVGGTGFYIKSALYNYEFNQDENFDYKKYDSLSNKEIYSKLIEKDPNFKIDTNNRVRLIRALYLADTNQKRSEKKLKNESLYNVLTIYLDVDRELLKSRLIERLNKMIEAGFIEEVKYLRNKNISLNIIGYRELNSYLNNEISLDDAKELIINASMKLAKRQKTWFKHQMNGYILDAFDNNLNSKTIKLVEEFLNE